MIHSRNKGKRGELELAEFLREHGHEATRGQQFKGGTDSPDVVCPSLPGIHIECKRVEAGQLYNWLTQAKKDCGSKVPIVAHRKNGKEWVAILPLSDLLRLFLTHGEP